MGETGLLITLGEPTANVTVYVINDAEIGASMVLGMDTIIALHGTLFFGGDEQMNPFFEIPNEGRLPTPRPVLATSLPISFVSQAWAAKNEAVISQGDTQYYRDHLTNRTFPIYGMVTIPSGNNTCQANYGSPPVPPARTINSRPDMPKMRPKRPCEIIMHGGPRLIHRLVLFLLVYATLCNHPNEVLEIKQLAITNMAVKAYLSTSLAISLGPDTEFLNPVTGRVFPILWGSRFFIDFGNTPNNGNRICRSRPRNRISINLRDGYPPGPGIVDHHERYKPHEPIIPKIGGKLDDPLDGINYVNGVRRMVSR
ncbi:hypothetical protein DAPPUDRAFT_102732 [Daphnia pulex]|uniref:Uncharacterized protein n=1 Tax=Daphnia pulex TaxID=6669 RepID=E9GHC1_DAPPU|nr:hypothetical protein DAPPUDRAFT_102732 [Daphnia pulex]|eukprot:EFX81165.1 hypothetical protein DAPPUDRAFT_102732 [Daphnia pulex]